MGGTIVYARRLDKLFPLDPDCIQKQLGEMEATPYI